MNLKYLLAGVLVIALIALASLGTNQITGFLASDGESNPQVRINIDYGEDVVSYSVDITSRDSALDALVRVASVDYRTEGELGAIVTGINGVKADDNNFWLYFVNGEMPAVACSHYQPIDGDVITFRYLTAEEAANYF